MVLVGHEADVSGDDQHRAAEDGVAPQAEGPFAAPGVERGQDEQAGERHQHQIGPQSAMKRPPEAHQAIDDAVGLFVVVDKKEVFVVDEEVEVDDQEHPQAEGNGRGAAGRHQQAEQAAPAAAELERHDPDQPRQEKQGGGLGEQHAGEDESDERGDALLIAEAWQADGEIHGAQGERQQQRLKDGEAAEGVKKRAGDEQSHGQQTDPARTALAKELVGQAQVEQEEGDGERAGSFNGDAGEEEEQPLEEGPHGDGRGGVEVARDVPVAEEVGADGGVAVPAFVGVLGPILPRGVIGEIRAEVPRVHRCEENEKGYP